MKIILLLGRAFELCLGELYTITFHFYTMYSHIRAFGFYFLEPHCYHREISFHLVAQDYKIGLRFGYTYATQFFNRMIVVPTVIVNINDFGMSSVDDEWCVEHKTHIYCFYINVDLSYHYYYLFLSPFFPFFVTYSFFLKCTQGLYGTLTGLGDFGLSN